MLSEFVFAIGAMHETVSHIGPEAGSPAIIRRRARGVDTGESGDIEQLDDRNTERDEVDRYAAEEGHAEATACCEVERMCAGERPADALLLGGERLGERAVLVLLRMGAQHQRKTVLPPCDLVERTQRGDLPVTREVRAARRP